MPRTLALSIARDGAVWLYGAIVKPEALADALVADVAAHPNTSVTVLLEVHRDLEYAAVKGVFAACARAGISHLEMRAAPQHVPK